MSSRSRLRIRVFPTRLRATLLLFALVVLLGSMKMSGAMEQRLLYFPDRQLVATPAIFDLSFEEVTLTTSDNVQLHGWSVPGEKGKPVVLFFHGNAGNISHRAASVEIFHRLGMNVFIFDYRGYGKSQGEPDENGLYADARAAWRYLTQQRGFEQGDIILFGRSLGGAVAAELAAEIRPGGLILESTISSARDVANAVFPILSRLIFLRYDFNTASHVRRVVVPVLVLHSPDDEIIPFHLGEKVFQAANEPKSFMKMRGDHNSGFLMSQPDYERALGAFVSLANPPVP